MADEFTIDAKYKRDNLVAEHERYRRRVEELEAELAVMRGAPRDDQIAETVRLDPDRVWDVLDASRDDQNDDGETLANTRGLFQEIRREIAISGRELEGEALAKWMDQRWPQFAEPGALSAASTKSSSGVAPKGEQEEMLRKIADLTQEHGDWPGYRLGQLASDVHNWARKGLGASPPPDRLIDEWPDWQALYVTRAIQAMEPGGAGNSYALTELRLLRDRLADREPE